MNPQFLRRGFVHSIRRSDNAHPVRPGAGPKLGPRFERPVLVNRGAMGAVYLAWDRLTSMPVAIKVMASDSQNSRRFEREARVLETLNHPNIVRYVSSGVTDGGPWLAMEWLRGEDLAAHLLRGPLSVEDTIALARGVADGLARAHTHGLIHRDIKPSNLFVVEGRFTQVKMLDFGIARVVGADDGVTKTGVIMGTLGYLAPEQVADAKRVDARADVFSLGAVLFHCLTGRAPFAGRSMGEYVVSLAKGEVRGLASIRPDVPRDLAHLVDAMLCKDREKRPTNGSAVVAALASADAAGSDSLTRIHVLVEFEANAPIMSARTAVSSTSGTPRTGTLVITT